MSNWLERGVFDSTNPHSISFRLRASRIRPLLDILEEVHALRGHARLLDIGGTREYWNIIPRARLEQLNVHITVANLGHPGQPSSDPMFTLVQADGCHLADFEDAAFHVAHSNSVLEHVGSRERMRCFANELRRVAPRHFVQTPNFWFPVEPHAMLPFFHWLPYALRLRLVQRFRLGHWPRQAGPVKAAQLLSENDLLTPREFSRLFPESRIRIERFLGLPKSLLAIR